LIEVSLLNSLMTISAFSSAVNLFLGKVILPFHILYDKVQQGRFQTHPLPKFSGISVY
jgi:hypothetical protein